jgi:branched-chain amino acid transport system ATP-binding protein
VSAGDTLLELNDLSAGYRGVGVVHGVDLHVDAGEVVALLGPNGAGKTTTLATISGLLPSLGGTMNVLTVPEGARRRRSSRRALQLRREGLAHVPEDRALFSGLTGREHLRLAAPRRDGAAVADALALFPALAESVERRAGLMSGGEQQMLAIARALVARPKLLMIDELSLGLAPIVVQSLLPTVRNIARETGVGVLLVEQHVRAVLAVADRAYVMARGRIAMHAPAAELAADPQRIADSYFDDG